MAVAQKWWFLTRAALPHPTPSTGRAQHLVAFRGAYIAPTEVAVVTELCLGGTLYAALSNGMVTWYKG